jgi:hypothetical protein
MDDSMDYMQDEQQRQHPIAMPAREYETLWHQLLVTCSYITCHTQCPWRVERVHVIMWRLWRVIYLPTSVSLPMVGGKGHVNDDSELNQTGARGCSSSSLPLPSVVAFFDSFPSAVVVEVVVVEGVVDRGDGEPRPVRAGFFADADEVGVDNSLLSVERGVSVDVVVVVDDDDDDDDDGVGVGDLDGFGGLGPFFG